MGFPMLAKRLHVSIVFIPVDGDASVRADIARENLGEPDEPVSVLLHVASQFDLEELESIRLDVRAERMGQAVINAILRQDLLVR